MAKRPPKTERPKRDAEARSGAMTSEFWLSMFPAAAGAAIAVIGAIRNDAQMMGLGLTASGVTSGIYTAGRSFVKRGPGRGAP